MFQSEIYSATDCIYYDDMSSDTSINFAVVGGTLTFDNNKLVLTRTSNGECYTELNSMSCGFNSQLLGKTIRCTCDIVSTDKLTRIIVYQRINESYSSATSQSISTSGTLSVDIDVNSFASRVLFRVNGNNLNSSETVEFNNLKIYPI